MNCRVAGENLAPSLIGDGVVCSPLEGHTWDCEVPAPVRRFWVSQNQTELVVVINRSQEKEETGDWSLYFLVPFLFAAGKFVIAFMRGPVSGHLTSWFLRKREKME